MLLEQFQGIVHTLQEIVVTYSFDPLLCYTEIFPGFLFIAHENGVGHLIIAGQAVGGVGIQAGTGRVF